MVIKPEAPAVLATKLIEAMGLDSNDFLEDYTADEFKEKAAKNVEEQSQKSMQTQELETRKVNADIELAEANVDYTKSQSRNTTEDNARSLAIMLDKHHQEWAELTIKAAKEGIEPPVKPSIEEIVELAKNLMGAATEQEAPMHEMPDGTMMPGESHQESPEMMDQMMQQTQ
jgi:hypothetical protein